MITRNSLDILKHRIETASLTGDYATYYKLKAEHKRLTKIHAIHENKRKSVLNKLIQELEQPRIEFPPIDYGVIDEYPKEL